MKIQSNDGVFYVAAPASDVHSFEAYDHSPWGRFGYCVMRNDERERNSYGKSDGMWMHVFSSRPVRTEV